jgi:hypothetical protein
VYIAWIIFYSYLTFIKIRVSIKKFNNEEWFFSIIWKLYRFFSIHNS